MSAPILPRAQAPIAANAPTTREWYDFFRALYALIGSGEATDEQLQALAERVAALEDKPAIDAVIQGLFSVQVTGQLADGLVVVQLQGDGANPGPTYYYGTGPDGGRGMHAVADTLAAAGGELSKAVDVDGVTTFGLADVTPTAGGTLRKVEFDAKGRRVQEGAATTDDLTEGAANLYYTDERADARIELQKGQPGGLATLDGAGKLDGGQLPALAITETSVVADEAAMLALIAQQGDVAVRTDIDTTFILTTEPASTLANWQELLSPTAGAVTSFNGRTGNVVPQSGDYTAAQVGADPTGTAAAAVAAHVAEVDPHPQYTTASEAAAAAPVQSVNGATGAVSISAAGIGAEPAIAAGTTAQYWRGDKTWRDFATDVRAAVLTGLSTATNAAIAATDTVLQALGKLQAQVSANIIAIASKLNSSAVSAFMLTVLDDADAATARGTLLAMPLKLEIAGTNADYTYLPEDANVARGKTTGTPRTYTVDCSVLTVGAYYYAGNYSSSGNVTLTAGVGTTLRLAGTATTGNRTVGPFGLGRIWIRSATEAWVDGPGVT